MLALALAAGMLALAPEGVAPRGNEVLVRDRGVILGVAAVPRASILIGDGRRVIQPGGFGAELQFRAYALHLGRLRFGGEAHLGHTRVLERRRVPSDDGTSVELITRYAALDHTDFSAGPSVQIALGPVLLEGGAVVGVGISNLVRPFGPFIIDEEQVSDVTAMIRGGGQISIPIRNDQGIVLGVHATRFFSQAQVVSQPDPELPDALPDANPFDLVLEVGIGYQMWFSGSRLRRGGGPR
ncbi:MAG: hypothetical protein AB1Z98_27590 [Nannocystaceae bacterium]